MAHIAANPSFLHWFIPGLLESWEVESFIPGFLPGGGEANFDKNIFHILLIIGLIGTSVSQYIFADMLET